MKRKFKKGQTITAIQRGLGLEEATIMEFVEYNGRDCYKVSIPCGHAYVPVESQVNYELKK